MEQQQTYTYEEIRQWPAAVDLITAARVFRIGRTSAYEMAAAGTFPARVVRVGARYVVVTESILAVLGAGEREGSST